MPSRRVLVLTDNVYLYGEFSRIAEGQARPNVIFDYRYSPRNKGLEPSEHFSPLDVKKELDTIVATYDSVISLHCKQLFPAEMVRRIRCVNIHPGYNPHNRGWFPQVFSILNKKPLGATIHEIDEELDHGPIIAQRLVPVHQWDTSLTAYNRVLEAEIQLIEQNLQAMVDGSYVAQPASEEGNVNYQKDFRALCQLNLDEVGTMGAFIDQLRALSHGEFRNGYFLDQSGSRVFVKLLLERETDDRKEA